MSATEIISEGPEGIILESVLEGYADTTPPTLPRMRYCQKAQGLQEKDCP